jgi:hypothetical protein
MTARFDAAKNTANNLQRPLVERVKVREFVERLIGREVGTGEGLAEARAQTATLHL